MASRCFRLAAESEDRRNDGVNPIERRRSAEATSSLAPVGFEPTETPLPAQPLPHGVVAATGASALFVASGYVLNVVLGRALGPVEYGLFGVVIGLMRVINSIQVSGVPQAIAKLTAERTDRARDLLSTGMVVQITSGVLLATALFLTADPLAAFVGDGRLADGFRVAAVALIPYALFSLLTGHQGGRGRYIRQALMLSAYSTAKAVFAVGLGLLFALPGAIAGYVIAPIVGIITGGTPELPTFRTFALRRILVLSMPLLALAAVSVAYLNVDLLLIKTLVPDPAAAGYYAAAQNISRVPYFLTGGLATLLLPAVARAAVRGQANAGGVVSEALRFGLLLVTPLAVLLAATAHDLLALFYGQPYVPASAALVFLSAAMAIFAIVGLETSLLAGGGRADQAVLAAALGLACSVSLATVLIPSYGIRGGAMATLAGAVVALVIATGAALRLFSFRIPWLTVARGVLASVLVGTPALFLSGTAATVIGLPALALAYGVLLILLREVTSKDWQRLRGLLPTNRPTSG